MKNGRNHANALKQKAKFNISTENGVDCDGQEE